MQKNVLLLIKLKGFKNITYLKCKQGKICSSFAIKYQGLQLRRQIYEKIMFISLFDIKNDILAPYDMFIYQTCLILST